MADRTDIEGLRAAVALYDQWCAKWSKDWLTEAPPDGAINTYTYGQLIDAVRALLDKLDGLRKIARTGVELDNHHNAAMCPYCRPTLEDEREKLRALLGALAAARKVLDGAIVRGVSGLGDDIQISLSVNAVAWEAWQAQRR